MVLTKCPIQNGTELWTPGDEYNQFWREGSPKLLKTKLTEQFGTPLPRGRLIILVTRRPEFSAILNWALRKYHAFWPPFWQVNLQVFRSLVAPRIYLEMLQLIHGLEKFLFHEPGVFI